MTKHNIGFILVGLIVGFYIGAFLFRPVLAPKNPGLETPASFLVYLAGQVHREGAVQIDFDRHVTVTQAIIQDGGLADLGDAQRIKLLRKQADGTSNIIPVDFKKALSGTAPDPVVQPGDLINVPEHFSNF